MITEDLNRDNDGPSDAYSKSHKDEPDTKRPAEAWTISDRLKAASILVTFLVSVLSVLVGIYAHDVSSGLATAVEADRVEADHIITNSNASDYANPWAPWEEPVTPTTIFVGIQRKVLFKQPFSTTPTVSTSFSLVDIKPTAQMLKDLGYHHTLDDDSGVSDFHILTEADKITPTGFTLEAGIGVRMPVGQFLSAKLQQSDVEENFVAEMLRYGQLSDRRDLTLSQDERWMTNFYRQVGTFQISWIAQARAK